MAVVRILVLVMTYPTLSRRYGQIVCTAGLTEDGAWVRLHPVPYPRLNDGAKFEKYDWIETSIKESKGDDRPETFKPVDPLAITRPADQNDDWSAKKSFILKHCRIHTNLETLIKAAHQNQLSLALFKPTRILRFTHSATNRDWNAEKLRQIRSDGAQQDLFESNWRQNPAPIPKFPFKFFYEFYDGQRHSRPEILDWDIGKAYWKHLHESEYRDEFSACTRVVVDFHDRLIARSDLHFILGTTFQFARRAPNPWVIIGLLAL